ncbi:hypothetical protein [Salipiger mucosus]|uniref:hypothetical protein n=1 Tax=Salipiger mucosus TaxID=263378 RepID=UPI00035D1189|nr:hypothetical protein [Salipiger mucosus]
MQAAFVRLDECLDVVKSINLKIERNPYAVPGPKALEVTGLRPSDLHGDDRVSEFEAARKVADLVGRRSTAERQKKMLIFGYNILSYDEQLLRYFLFRNLQDTYLTTGKNARRLDLYPAFQYLHFISPGIILPGQKDDGTLSWRLSDVMEANGKVSENAHDAEADTLMTKDLLVDFIHGAPNTFNKIVELSDKRTVSGLLGANMHGENFVFEFSHFGMPEITPLAPMAKVGHSGYKTLGVDLAVHPREWMSMSAREIADNLYRGDSPFRIVKHNSCPLIFDRNDADLRGRLDEIQYRSKVETYERRAEYIRRPDIVRKFQEVTALMEQGARDKFSGRKVTREAELYNGFTANEDRNLCRIISEEDDWERRMPQVAKIKDPRIKEFAGRLIAMSAPEDLVREEDLLALREQYALRLNDEDDSGVVQTIAIAEQELENVEDPDLRAECAEMLKTLRLEFAAQIRKIDERIDDLKAFEIAQQEKNEIDLELFV